MDGAQTEAVRDDWLAVPLKVARYVGGIKEAALFQAADGARTFVRAKDAAAKDCLVQADTRPHARRTCGRPSFEWHGLSLVDRSYHLAGRDEDALADRIIGGDVV